MRCTGGYLGQGFDVQAGRQKGDLRQAFRHHIGAVVFAGVLLSVGPCLFRPRQLPRPRLERSRDTSTPCRTASPTTPGGQHSA